MVLIQNIPLHICNAILTFQLVIIISINIKSMFIKVLLTYLALLYVSYTLKPRLEINFHSTSHESNTFPHDWVLLWDGRAYDVRFILGYNVVFGYCSFRIQIMIAMHDFKRLHRFLYLKSNENVWKSLFWTQLFEFVSRKLDQMIIYCENNNYFSFDWLLLPKFTHEFINFTYF